MLQWQIEMMWCIPLSKGMSDSAPTLIDMLGATLFLVEHHNFRLYLSWPSLSVCGVGHDEIAWYDPMAGTGSGVWDVMPLRIQTDFVNALEAGSNLSKTQTLTSV